MANTKSNNLLLIERISHTDDEALLQQCLQVLAVETEKGRESHEGDEIVEHQTVAGQMHAPLSDKRLLVNSALGIQMKEAAAEEPAALPQSSAARPQSSAAQPQSSAAQSQDPAAHAADGTGAVAEDKGRRIKGKGSGWTVGALLGMLAIAAGTALLSPFWGNADHDGNQKTVAADYCTFTVADVQFNMVRVEGGTFTMGALPNELPEADSDESPAHQVTLSSYYIGETEVTQQLWKAVMGSTVQAADGDRHPMKNVSWDDCVQFVEKLSAMTGLPFTLPTEAQWEFAARGGLGSHNYLYAGSNNVDDVAWYSANSWDKGKGNPGFGNHEVATKAPNELGLYDMSGNVWEWCLDSYGKYTTEPQTDPKGIEGKKTSFKVNRGGSWDYIANSSRTSNRRNRTPDFRNFNLGLRLALPDGQYK